MRLSVSPTFKIIGLTANIPLHHIEHLFIRYNIPTIYTFYNRFLLRVWLPHINSENHVFNEAACLENKTTAPYTTREREIWHIPQARTQYDVPMLNKLPSLLNSLHYAGFQTTNT